MPTPTIPNGKLYFDVPIWTGVGTSSALTISSLQFQPDFVWGKPRSLAYSHSLSDSVRGANIRLSSGSTGAEETNFTYGYTSSFNSNGFTTTPGSTDNENWNTTGSTFVAWCWKANGTAVSNTDGSITSQVSANTTSGFSVVTYTGNASIASFGHGLGVTPSLIIIKNRSTSGSGSQWCVGINISGWNWSTDYLYLNSTAAKATDGGTTQFYSAPTSTVVNIGGGTNTNGSGNSMVAYCWAPIAGYSAFGSYTGNGSADGPFVYLGFRPRFIMYKRTDTTGDWYIFDSARSSYNAMNNVLFPNASNAEDTGGFWIDALSNGFKQRGTGANSNASGGTYIYAAFAENPFKYANAR